MNKKLIASLSLSLSLGSAAHAAVVQQGSMALSDLVVTTTSISFTISGTLQGALPNSNEEFLFVSTGLDGVDFLNSGGNINPSILGGLSSSVSGPSTKYFIENGSGIGDRISIGFGVGQLTPGETFSGSVTLTASTPQIKPQAFFDYGYAIHWGREQASSSHSPYTGTFQGSGPIPEPSSVFLACCGMIACALRRTRRAA